MGVDAAGRGEHGPLGFQPQGFEAVQQQMAHLQQTLAVIEYKCWYYETAKAAGTTAALAGVEIPPQFRQVWQQLHQPEEP